MFLRLLVARRQIQQVIGDKSDSPELRQRLETQLAAASARRPEVEAA